MLYYTGKISVSNAMAYVFYTMLHIFIGEGNGTPLQYSCLENPMDGGAWWAAVYGVAQSRTRLKRLSSSSSSRDILHKTLPTGIAYIRTSIMTTIKILFTERSWSSLLINNYC